MSDGKKRKGSRASDASDAKDSPSPKKGGKSAKATPTYVLKIHVDSGSSLTVAGVDPYLVFSLQGTSEKVLTQFIEGATDPIWNEDVTVISSGSPANDLLEVELRGKDAAVDAEKNPLLGIANLWVHDIPIGGPIPLEIALSKCDKKRRAVAGSAGTVHLAIDIAQADETPFGDPPPAFKAVLAFASIEGVPPGDGDSGPPFLELKLKAKGQNAQKWKSEPLEGDPGSISGQIATFFVSANEEKIDLFLKRKIGGKDTEIGSCKVGLKEFAVGQDAKKKRFKVKPREEGAPAMSLTLKGTVEVVVPSPPSPSAAVDEPVPAPADGVAEEPAAAEGDERGGALEGEEPVDPVPLATGSEGAPDDGSLVESPAVASPDAEEVAASIADSGSNATIAETVNSEVAEDELVEEVTIVVSSSSALVEADGAIPDSSEAVAGDADEKDADEEVPIAPVALDAPSLLVNPDDAEPESPEVISLTPFSDIVSPIIDDESIDTVGAVSNAPFVSLSVDDSLTIPSPVNLEADDESDDIIPVVIASPFVLANGDDVSADSPESISLGVISEPVTTSPDQEITDEVPIVVSSSSALVDADGAIPDSSEAITPDGDEKEADEEVPIVPVALDAPSLLVNPDDAEPESPESISLVGISESITTSPDQEITDEVPIVSIPTDDETSVSPESIPIGSISESPEAASPDGPVDAVVPSGDSTSTEKKKSKDKHKDKDKDKGKEKNKEKGKEKSKDKDKDKEKKSKGKDGKKSKSKDSDNSAPDAKKSKDKGKKSKEKGQHPTTDDTSKKSKDKDKTKSKDKDGTKTASLGDTQLSTDAPAESTDPSPALGSFAAPPPSEPAIISPLSSTPFPAVAEEEEEEPPPPPAVSASPPPPAPQKQQSSPLDGSAIVFVSHTILISGKPYEFSFGEYGSVYSDEFHGYTNYASLSPGDPNERYELRPLKPFPVKKVVATGKLSGRVLQASGLAKTDNDGTSAFVTVRVVDGEEEERTAPQKSSAVRDTADPKWDFDFNLGSVESTLAVEFFVWQSHKLRGDQQIGYAKILVRDIEPNQKAPIQVRLRKPPEPDRKIKKAKSFGEISVSFRYRLQ